MNNLALVFQPIDLDRHGDVFLTFVRDTHFCSFGTMDGFLDDNGQGEERFAERVRARLAEEPKSCLHVWKNGQIVGQLHLGRFIDPSIGYINLLYVAPEWRGAGIASLIEEYASAYFQSHGFRSARLSVAAHNLRAIRFYTKQGWKNLGPRQDQPDRLATHTMEKFFGPITIE